MVLHPIRSIIIPEILRNIRTSEARRATYFIKEKLTDELEIPKKYQDKLKFEFVPYKVTRGIVYRLSNIENPKKPEPVIKNILSVGTPKDIKINFQKIWNGLVSDHVRNKIAKALKDSYEAVLAEVETIPKEAFPLKTLFTFHTKDELQDVDNLSILYIKTFHDALVGATIIPDDKLNYIKGYEVKHEDDADEYIQVDIYSLADNFQTDPA